MNETSMDIKEPVKSTQVPYPLIINADDLGLSPAINSTIAKSFCKGMINSTSLIVNMEGFEEAVALAEEYDFKNRIGIHINLTEGFPLTDLSNTGLVDEEGRFMKRALHRPSIYFSRSIKRKIKEEIQQQYKKAINQGIKPTHINSHHHVHTLPWIYKIFIDFAKKHNLKVRIAQTKTGKSFLKDEYRKWLNRQYKKNHINFSDHFENAVFLLNDLHKIKDRDAIFEVMVHPVYQQDQIIDNFSKRRLDELVTPITNFFRQNGKSTVMAALHSAAFIW